MNNSLIEWCENEGEFGTAGVGKDTRNRFIRDNGREVKFSEINFDFVQDWVRKMQKAKLSTTYIGINLRTFRTMVNRAIRKGYVKGNVIVDLCPRINNYPWPIITLYKMYHIESNFDFSCDYSCYFNGNATIFPHDIDIFDTNKITVSYHSFNDKNKNYNAWQYININKESRAYLKNGTYEYIQGGFFFGRSDLIYYMCKDVTEMVKFDTGQYLIAQWHDESYLNKWCVEHPDIVDKKYIILTRGRFLRATNNYTCLHRGIVEQILAYTYHTINKVRFKKAFPYLLFLQTP